MMRAHARIHNNKDFLSFWDWSSLLYAGKIITTLVCSMQLEDTKLAADKLAKAIVCCLAPKNFPPIHYFVI